MSGWVTKKLGEIGTCKNGLNFKRAAVGKVIDIVGVGDFKKGLVVDDTTDLERLTLQELPEEEWYLQPNDIVFVRSNGSKALVGRAVIIKTKRPLTFSGFCIRYRIEDKSVDPDYLVRMVSAENFRRAMLVGRNASTINNVTQSILLSQVIRFPPLAEQKQIVAKIDAAFEKIDKLKANAEKNLANAKELFQSALDEAMRPKKGWGEKRLPDISVNNDNKRVPITKSQREPGSIPYYGASGIVDYVKDYIFDGDYLLVSEDGANLESRTYPIAFSITGKSWVNNHAHILEFKNADVQAYVELYLNAISLKDFITGTAQPKLTQENLNRIPIHIPDEHAKLSEIVSRLKLIKIKLETLQQNYARQIADCAEMRQAILREAFEGRM